MYSLQRFPPTTMYKYSIEYFCQPGKIVRRCSNKTSSTHYRQYFDFFRYVVPLLPLYGLDKGKNLLLLVIILVMNSFCFIIVWLVFQKKDVDEMTHVNYTFYQNTRKVIVNGTNFYRKNQKHL